MRLELGSGYHPTAGFVHLDTNVAAPHVEIVGDAADPHAYGVDLASVSELRAVDVLEHISYRETDQALRRWVDVLEPRGRVYVQVPDADLIMRWWCGEAGGRAMLRRRIPSELPQTSLSGVAWRLLGGHDDGDNGRDDFRLNAHFSLWSETSLRLALAGAGLTVESIEVNDHPNLCAWATKP